MSRVQNVIKVSNEARQKAGRWWAAHLYMAVNYGVWDRNISPLEIETSEGIVDVSRAVRSSRTTTAERGADARGGVLVGNRQWQVSTTDGKMSFCTSINLAQYEWREFCNETKEEWLLRLLNKYFDREPRYGMAANGLKTIRNTDAGSSLHTGARAERYFLCEPDLEDRRDASQLLAFMTLDTRLPLGCFEFTQQLVSNID
jgi:hypothetical protein